MIHIIRFNSHAVFSDGFMSRKGMRTDEGKMEPNITQANIYEKLAANVTKLMKISAS